MNVASIRRAFSTWKLSFIIIIPKTHLEKVSKGQARHVAQFSKLIDSQTVLPRTTINYRRNKESWPRVRKLIIYISDQNSVCGKDNQSEINSNRSSVVIRRAERKQSSTND
ncbi:hypothetical protein CEXT_458401 [Caerostris extrusa]|uniref:Uncharacterized protein n=1 Tax=Caerostris extrusa TaxID=172846 RepID=A0AAV4R499_CAEEX|nr:hypothetical protein CEXT_458401 [Caerostris extrusa]